MVATPSVCGIATTSINPTFLKIFLMPRHIAAADSDKYP
jgi:hypothetical protein